LSLQDVSTRLLLSVNQIRGLEAENQQAFYNDWFYVQAAKKYSGFLNITLPESLLNAAEHPALSRMSPVMQSGNSLKAYPNARADLGSFSDHNSTTRRPVSVLFFSLLFLVLAIGIGVVVYVKWPFEQVVETAVNDVANEVAPEPPEPVQVATPVVPVPPTKPITQLTLTFKGACWIQAINTDGTRVEKIFNDGEKLDLNLLTLNKLVIGNVVATKMLAGDLEVPLSSLTNRGSAVARLTGTELTAHIDRLK
jgi:cytoskeletal protein RodZ